MTKTSDKSSIYRLTQQYPQPIPPPPPTDDVLTSRIALLVPPQNVGHLGHKNRPKKRQQAQNNKVRAVFTPLLQAIHRHRNLVIIEKLLFIRDRPPIDLFIDRPYAKTSKYIIA